MNTNKPELEAQDSKLLFRHEVYQTAGSAMEVLNGIGHGLNEKIYENALVVEFKLRGITFNQQKHFGVLYKGVQVGEFIPDLITHESVVVDTKVIDRIHRSRTRPDVKLSPHHQAARRRHYQFQARKA